MQNDAGQNEERSLKSVRFSQSFDEVRKYHGSNTGPGQSDPRGSRTIFIEVLVHHNLEQRVGESFSKTWRQGIKENVNQNGCQRNIGVYTGIVPSSEN